MALFMYHTFLEAGYETCPKLSEVKLGERMGVYISGNLTIFEAPSLAAAKKMLVSTHCVKCGWWHAPIAPHPKPSKR